MISASTCSALVKAGGGTVHDRIHVADVRSCASHGRCVFDLASRCGADGRMQRGRADAARTGNGAAMRNRQLSRLQHNLQAGLRSKSILADNVMNSGRFCEIPPISIAEFD
jgi:hypothetical protein